MRGEPVSLCVFEKGPLNLTCVPNFTEFGALEVFLEILKILNFGKITTAHSLNSNESTYEVSLSYGNLKLVKKQGLLSGEEAEAVEEVTRLRLKNRHF